MAQRLTSMTVDALIKLRDQIGAVLGSKAAILKKELAALGERYAEVNSGKKAKSTLQGRKVPAKYRGPHGETWAGRGATPVWMRDAIKGGKKAEDFLIAKGNGQSKIAKGNGKSKKVGRRKKKR